MSAVAPWIAAHERWQAGAPVAEAAAELPQGLATILRAIDVLHRDDERAARGLLDEAQLMGAPGVAELLGVAINGGDTIRIVPALWPSSELITMLRKWLDGGSPRGSKGLIAAIRGKPVAETARTVFAKRGSRQLTLPGADLSMDRVFALGLALWGARLGGQRSAEQLLEHSPSGYSLDLSSYGALDKARSRCGGASRLGRWIDGDPWTPGTATLLETHGSSSMLSAAIKRIQADIEAGRLGEVVEALAAAAKLACSLGKHDLERDLQVVEDRLRWACTGQAPEGLLVAVWREAKRRGESPQAMLVLAEELARALPPNITSSEAQAVVVTLLRHGRSARSRAEVVSAASDHLSPEVVRRSLAERTDLPPGELPWLVGLQAVCGNSPVIALEQASELLRQGIRLADACDLLLAAWPKACVKRAKKPIVVAARASIGALVAAGSVDPESAHRLAQALGSLRQGLGKQRQDVRAVVRASAEQTLAPSDPNLGHILAMRAGLDGATACQPILRSIGRTLRSLEPPAADAFALDVIARAIQWERRPHAAMLCKVIEPLEAWLNHAGGERILAAGRALGGRVSTANVYAAWWILQSDEACDYIDESASSHLLTRLLTSGMGAGNSLRTEAMDQVADEVGILI